MNIMNKIKTNWDKATLILIMAITGFLTFYAIGGEGYSNQYYASAVKSMLSSWHNFFFASFDPGGYVTVDKPALGLWLQALSAFIFGFHGWSIILPEALSGVISVALIFHIVNRSFGKAAGIMSAFILGLTPILIAVGRTNNLDSSLVMVLLLATWTLIVAAERGSLKMLLLSMALVGIGFNIKMLQAFMVLPAFYLVYLFVSKQKMGKRILHLTCATAVLMAVALSWAVIVDSTPADSRPYVGGSKSNSVIELALGYNGIQRLTGNESGHSQDGGIQDGNGQFPAPTDSQGASSRNDGNFQRPDGNTPDGFNRGPDGQDGPGNGGGGPGGTGENGQKGILRIFNENLAGQISWFLPLALFGILILSIRAFRKDESNRNNIIRHLVLFAAMIIPMIAFFSIAGFYHRYYLSMLAPGIAALAGIGIIELWKSYMDMGWKWVLLPAALLTSSAIQILILSNYNGWNNLLSLIVLSVCTFAAAALIVIRLRKKEQLDKTIKAVIAAAFVSLLLAPAVWSYTPILYGSQTVMPVAGPELQNGGMNRGIGSNNFINNMPGNDSSSQMVDFLLNNYTDEKYLVAVADANSAASIILETGKPVMAVGGFSGSDDILTVERLQQMVANGELRYFVVGNRGMGQQSEINTWVEEHGTVVTFDNIRSGSGTLYDLAPVKNG